MWLLEAPHELFAGRRLWLRPGRRYLFGRTEAEAGQIAIVHRTVSRQHMTIVIGDVSEGDAHNLDKRSLVTITDLNTKSGTTINGKLYRDAAHEVRDDIAILTIGKYEKEFRLIWYPVNLYFSFSSRELQADPMRKLRQQVEQLDVKLTLQYGESITHCVAKKRNTSKGLQALIDAKYIVLNSFIDAIEDIAAPVSDQDSTSLLEGDFDGNWPNELDYLPPRTNEKSDRPTTEYAPDPDRANVFEGYSYVFYEKSQFDNLLPAITAGRGKALLCQAQPNKTTVDDFVRYVKAVAGEKGLGSFEDGSEGKGVVVVRFTPFKGDHVDWYRMFFESVSLRLDHRLIEQGEFLEAVLVKEPRILRRPLQEEEVRESVAALVSASGQNTFVGEPRSENIAQSDIQRAASRSESMVQSDIQETVPKRTRPRRQIKRHFAGFDDDEDNKEDVAVESAPPSPRVCEPSPRLPGPESQLFVRQEASPPPPTRPTRKRAASPFIEEDIMEIAAPNAMAYKRRRLELGEEEQPFKQEAESKQEPEASKKRIKTKLETKSEPEVAAAKKKGKVKVSASDMLDLDTKRLQEVDDARRLADLEVSSSRVAALTEEELAAIRALSLVEDIEPIDRARRSFTSAAGPNQAQNPRWDDKWNGRKNFKRFRRQGQAPGRRPIRNIIPLVESRQKDFGIGDNYWLETPGRAPTDTGADHGIPSQQTQTQMQSEFSAAWREFGRSLSKNPPVRQPSPVARGQMKWSGRPIGGRVEATPESDDVASLESWEDATRFRRPTTTISASVESRDAPVKLAPETIVLDTDSEDEAPPSRRTRASQRISPQTTRTTRAASRTQTQTQITQPNTPPSQAPVCKTGVKRGVTTTSFGREEQQHPSKRQKATTAGLFTSRPVHDSEDEDSDDAMRFVM